MAKRGYNHPLTHIGLTVSDIDAAVKWYVEVLGFRQLAAVGIEDRDKNDTTAAMKIMPSVVRKVKIAYLGSANSVGLELFEFLDPKIEPSLGASWDVRLRGIFHFAITTSDIEGMGQKVVDNGGMRVGERGSLDDEEGLYVQDPWGNVIELITCSLEQLVCNR